MKLVVDIDICNQALSFCNVRPITSISEISHEADTIKIWYDQSLNSTFSAIHWKFARQFISLASVPEDQSVPGWDFTYKLPVDCMQVLNVEQERSNEWGEPSPFEIMGPNVCSDVESAYLFYISNAIEPAYYATDFRTCAALMLATNIVGELTGQNSLGNNIYQKYQNELMKSRAANVIQEKKLAAKDKRYAESRSY